MIKYEIEGGNLPVVICYPEAGQTLCTESGAMSWMSPNMHMETNTGGGLRKALGRMLSGESVFLNEYTPVGGSGLIAFASGFPGSVIAYEVTPGNGIIVQKKGFLAMEKGLDLSVYFQKKLGKGFFGGEGFIMQRITGRGMVFLEIDGYRLSGGHERNLDPGCAECTGGKECTVWRRRALPYSGDRTGQGLYPVYAHLPHSPGAGALSEFRG